MIALRRVDQVREPERVGAWLHAVVHNVCMMQLRRGSSEVPVADIAPGVDRSGAAASVEQQIDAMCLRDWVWAELAELSEPLRVVTTLRYFGRHASYEEIAATCGVPVGTVRSRLHQAKTELGGRCWPWPMQRSRTPAGPPSSGRDGLQARSKRSRFAAIQIRTRRSSPATCS